MPAVYKVTNSPFWICQFLDATGKRVTRSTKQTKQSDARKVADLWERMGEMARRREMTQAASIKLMNEALSAIGANPVDESSITDFFNDWIKSNASALSLATVSRYKGIVKNFIENLSPDRARARIHSLSSEELQTWYDSEIAAGKTPKTAGLGLSIIRAALETKRRHGLFLTNPADAVRRQTGGADKREPFTPEELKLLLKAATPEWQGMIALGAHAALRIGDAANLTWESLDLENGTLTFWPSKTVRKADAALKIALHPEAVEILSKLPRGIGKAPVFPSLYGSKTGSHGGLSNAFSALMQTAGLAVTKGRAKTGKGRVSRNKGFHALRHTMISSMADAGISADVRQAIAGHSSDAIHKRYTHLSLAAQRAAIAKMPSIAS